MNNTVAFIQLLQHNMFSVEKLVHIWMIPVTQSWIHYQLVFSAHGKNKDKDMLHRVGHFKWWILDISSGLLCIKKICLIHIIHNDEYHRWLQFNESIALTPQYIC